MWRAVKGERKLFHVSDHLTESSTHESKVKVIRHSRKSISGPLTSHVLLHLIQHQPKTLTSNCAKHAARRSVLESKFLARSARTDQSVHFFRVPKARFSSTSNERNSVTGSRLLRPNRKNRLCGRHEKTVASDAWTAPASATAPRSPILLPLGHTFVIVALALWLLHPGAGCPTRKVGLSKKKLRTLTERGSRESLPWGQAHSCDVLGPVVLSPSQTRKTTESEWRQRNPMHGARTSKERSPH